MKRRKVKRKLIFDKEGVKAFALHFKSVREDNGFTQAQLSFESGVSLSQIARIETGQINTTISTVFAIARAMEINPDEFFRFELK